MGFKQCRCCLELVAAAVVRQLGEVMPDGASACSCSVASLCSIVMVTSWIQEAIPLECLYV